MKKLKYAVTNHLDCLEKETINYSKYEVSFRRWLVSEVDRGHLTVKEICAKFGFSYDNFRGIFREWQKRYSEKIYVSLRDMTPEEQTQIEELQKRIEELEQQLEDSQIKNVLTEAMIDIAEEEFKIEIRKKPGAKQ